MRSVRIGYFGGTFDPPHLGHMIIAHEARYHLDLSKVNWIITPDPPHKTNRVVTPQEHRLEMLKRVVDLEEGFEISDVDIQRSSPHYAADTVEILKRQNPEIEMVYIIGEDSLRDLASWYEPDRFLSAVDILAVYPRPDIVIDIDQLEVSLPGLDDKLYYLDEIEIDISSSMIRDRVSRGGRFEHFLSKEVGEYIKENALYSN